MPSSPATADAAPRRVFGIRSALREEAPELSGDDVGGTGLREHLQDPRVPEALGIIEVL
jgi:hypothetical protein